MQWMQIIIIFIFAFLKSFSVDVDGDSDQNLAPLCQHCLISDKYQKFMCWSKSSIEHLHFIIKKCSSYGNKTGTFAIVK